MKEDGRLFKALERFAKTKIGNMTLRIVYNVWDFASRIKSYFEKDVHIIVRHIHVQNEDGDFVKEPDSFNIYICEKGKCEGLFSYIDWEEADKIIDLLEEDDKPVKLEMKVGMGTSYLYVPKWAKDKLISEIKAVKEGER